MTWLPQHLIVIFLVSFVITFIEIFSEYPKDYSIAYRSKHSWYLFLFNFLIGISLFLLNANGILKIFDTSDPWKLVIITGLSGFLFFNSKIDIKKVNFDSISGVKSYFSRMKSKIYNIVIENIEEDYPAVLLTKISTSFDYERTDDFVKFALIIVERSNKEDDKNFDLSIIDNIINISEMDKVYIFTKELLDRKGVAWVEKFVLREYCVRDEE